MLQSDDKQGNRISSLEQKPVQDIQTRVVKGVSVVIPVFQRCERALIPVAAMCRQSLPDSISLQIIVVDDGSTDNSSDVIESVEDDRVQLYPLSQNRGRSAARNAGAERADGEVLVFMDCDCVPLDNELLASHLDALKNGNAASTGPVVGIGGGFWDRYQRDASCRRESLHTRGGLFSGTSQNLALYKSAFERVGGFDTAYAHYGFEDRDLLLRLGSYGSVAWTGKAVVQHTDALTLRAVCDKMAEAGQYTARRFASRHPAAYKELGYAAMDAKEQRWLAPIGRAMGPFMPRLAQMVEPMLDRRWMPYQLAKLIVKLAGAISFTYGSTRALEPS